MKQLIFLIYIVTLPFGIASAGEYVKPETSMFFVLDHRGKMTSRHNSDADNRYRFKCYEEPFVVTAESSIEVKHGEGIHYRFPNTKGETSSEKCKALKAKLEIYGAKRKIEIEVDPRNNSILSTKEIEIVVAKKVVAKSKAKINREVSEDQRKEIEAKVGSLNSADLDLPLDEILEKVYTKRQEPVSGGSSK